MGETEIPKKSLVLLFYLGAAEGGVVCGGMAEPAPLVPIVLMSDEKCIARHAYHAFAARACSYASAAD